MIGTDAEAALFSVKTFAAAMLGYYVALRIGFAQPVWAVTTVYFVAQPLAGAVLSKALFRVLGTLLGATAAVLFLPNFVNEPLVLTFVLALWLGVCVYRALIDRTPGAYVFLLAGYTASIIGFPGVLTPGNIFNTAVSRVEEIVVGIVSVSLVHGAILPRTITKRLQQQIAALVKGSEQVSREALSGSRSTALDQERRRLAVAINEIDQLAHHVAFDTARLLPSAAAIGALQEQACWLLPLSGAVEDRVAECAAQGQRLPGEVTELIAGAESWFADGDPGPARDATARQLVAKARDLGRLATVGTAWCWRELLLINLLARLAELIQAHQMVRELQDYIRSGSSRSLSPEAARLIHSPGSQSLHRDRGLALRSASGATVALSIVCVFWIATAWPNGATAALTVGVGCALFATFPRPGVGIRRFLLGFLISIAAAAVYGFAILPRVTDFVTLAAVLAPLLLLFGCMLARPALAAVALGAAIGFIQTAGFAATYQGEFSSFINLAISEVVGVVVSIVAIDMFAVIGADVTSARLLRAGFRDIASRAEGKGGNTQRWIRRMIDRVALLSSRSVPTGAQPARQRYDALVGMRIGYLAGELHTLASAFPKSEASTAVEEALRNISAHFRNLSVAGQASSQGTLLETIDRAMAACAADPQPERRLHSSILLTGLRRSLFPDAPAFAAAGK